MSAAVLFMFFNGNTINQSLGAVSTIAHVSRKTAWWPSKHVPIHSKYKRPSISHSFFLFPNRKTISLSNFSEWLTSKGHIVFDLNGFVWSSLLFYLSWAMSLIVRKISTKMLMFIKHLKGCNPLNVLFIMTWKWKNEQIKLSLGSFVTKLCNR